MVFTRVFFFYVHISEQVFFTIVLDVQRSKHLVFTIYFDVRRIKHVFFQQL